MDSTAGSASTEPAVSLTGRWITLRPASLDDIPIFFRWRADVHHLHIWSSRKGMPTYDEFATELEERLRQSVTFVINNKRDSEPVGFVQAYSLNLGEGWCFTLEYTAPKIRRGHGAEAFVYFLDYLFRTFPLRKVYADTYEFNQDSTKPLLSRGFVEEGRLLQHIWFGERYWDVIRLGLFREDWDRFRERSHLLVGVAQDADHLMAEGTDGTADPAV